MRGGDLDTAGDDDVVGAAQHGEPAVRVHRAEVIGAVPADAVFLEKRVPGFGRVEVAGGHGVAAQQDAAVVGHPDLHTFQRHAVVHAAAARLRGPVGGDDPDAGIARRGQQPVRRRRAAQQDAVEPAQDGQGLRRRRIQEALQLGGYQRGEADPVGQLQGAGGEGLGCEAA